MLTDPYRVARAYGIEDPVIFQALKKLLRCGRKHKAKAADVREAITSLERWEAMNRGGSKAMNYRKKTRARQSHSMDWRKHRRS